MLTRAAQFLASSLLPIPQKDLLLAWLQNHGHSAPKCMTHMFLALLVFKLTITLVHSVQLFDSRRDECRFTALVERLFGVCSDVNHGSINECSLFSIKLLACITFLKAASTTPELGTKTREELS